jgi:hypothetical protein
VRYRQRILQEDGSAKLNHASKHLERSADFSNIFEVKRCRASFMQAVNRDRFSAHSRITLSAFVEGAYLPWTKEERRASTSKGHHEIIYAALSYTEITSFAGYSAPRVHQSVVGGCLPIRPWPEPSSPECRDDRQASLGRAKRRSHATLRMPNRKHSYFVSARDIVNVIASSLE